MKVCETGKSLTGKHQVGFFDTDGYRRQRTAPVNICGALEVLQ